MALPEKPVPYTFVPVVTEGAQARPVFDAVFHHGQPGLLSGELRCELTALTPLLVGHFQYQIKDRVDGKAVRRNGNDRWRLSDAWGDGLQGQLVDAGKSFLEPLFHGGERPDQARVVIPGASLKGMLRHNIGAMLGAPMERVQEQYFSYRPNLGWSTDQETYQCRMAIVQSVDLKKNILEINLLKQDAERAVFGSSRRGHVNKHTYVGGLDGDGILAAGRVHQQAWITDADVEIESVKVEEGIVSHYKLTQEELANTEFGHLSRR